MNLSWLLAAVVSGGFPEQSFDAGEAVLNYAVAGDDGNPPVLLMPGQSESWWGCEQAMPRLAEHFFAKTVVEWASTLPD